jgi:cell division GTPase FtsZ
VTGEAKIKVSSTYDKQQTHRQTFLYQPLSTSCPCMQVVGVGGGGSNAVNRMLANQLTGVEMYVMNTDAQVSPDIDNHPDCAP